MNHWPSMPSCAERAADSLKTQHRAFMDALKNLQLNNKVDQQVLELLARDDIMVSKKELINTLAELITMASNLPGRMMKTRNELLIEALTPYFLKVKSFFVSKEEKWYDRRHLVAMCMSIPPWANIVHWFGVETWYVRLPLLIIQLSGLALMLWNIKRGYKHEW